MGQSPTTDAMFTIVPLVSFNRGNALWVISTSPPHICVVDSVKMFKRYITKCNQRCNPSVIDKHIKLAVGFFEVINGTFNIFGFGNVGYKIVNVRMLVC